MSPETECNLEINDLVSIHESLKKELSKVIVGQETVVDNILLALFVGGHVLVEGIPGLGKSLLAGSLSRIMDGEYKRIQFTPDLMPSDIIGTTVYNAELKDFSIRKGPVFCNILLADEVNRSPAKTQSALLQVMQEKQVTLDGTDYSLDDYFICIATQNPIEMEGTYPLPEAQIDRFFMKILIDYPSLGEERDLLKNYRAGFDAAELKKVNLKTIVDKEMLRKIKTLIGTVTVDDKIIDYITNLVAATRDYPGIEVGASPRGSVDLFKGARVMAALSGRDYVIPDDVKDIAYPVLRHRMILEVEAVMENINPDELLRNIIDKVEVPR